MEEVKRLNEGKMSQIKTEGWNGLLLFKRVRDQME